jgi:hypothetical protein
MGVDIANEEGLPIVATGDGVVCFASWEGGYGKLVVIDHGFGYMTFYAHSSLILVGEGQKVKRGQVIAYMGSTGSSTGSHVHYEVQCNGGCVDPWRYMATVRVDGKLEGGISEASAIIVGERGEIRGDLNAGSAIIGGKVEGNITAVHSIEILKSADIHGDIKTSILSIAEGSTFEGNCVMVREKQVIEMNVPVSGQGGR